MSYTKTTWNQGGPPGISANALNNIEQGIYDAQDPAQVLDRIKTVDGSGSGLDADTVRGYVPVNQAGGTLTGKDIEIMYWMGAI